MDTVAFGENGIEFIDQTLLPKELSVKTCTTIPCLIEAIQALRIRGAPALGAAGAFGVALSARAHSKEKADSFLKAVTDDANDIANARPTAVNLQWGVAEQMKLVDPSNSAEETVRLLEDNAQRIAKEDIENNKRIGDYGSSLISKGDGILTHCNAGALACVGYGTALGVIRSAHAEGKDIHVYVDETRPLCQGSRLTAWEMYTENIPATLITDNMAGSLMASGKIQKIVVGADRITACGDVANKIGTYAVAVLARYHDIPFYVAAPVSTIDFSIVSGSEIPIEQRAKEEITFWQGMQNAPEGIDVYNPAFDVTPSSLVSAIITEKGIVLPPYAENLLKVKP